MVDPGKAFYFFSKKIVVFKFRFSGQLSLERKLQKLDLKVGEAPKASEENFANNPQTERAQTGGVNGDEFLNIKYLNNCFNICKILSCAKECKRYHKSQVQCI